MEEHIDGSSSVMTHEWVTILLTCVYWVFTVGAVIIFAEVLQGMAVRDKFLRKRYMSLP